jgi:adenylate cyclase
MEPKGFHRKLAAILSADVAGYSCLMQDNEAATVATLEAFKRIISDLVAQHRGRVVDSPGDNLLAEFASVVDAVQCAVAVQKELQARNAELPENRRMRFRIGVNLGDVIEEESRIYGDGVNIAARLESLADPGGICVSKTAFDQIETKLPFGYEFLGEQTVKNIAKPVGAYRVLLEPRVTKKKSAGLRHGAGRRVTFLGLVAALAVIAGVALWQFLLRPAARPPATAVEKADPNHMALPLPELPSIAVLPFTNLSEDPKQQLLCDGITDNVINALSKVPRLFVIARNSTFTYKGKAPKAKQVSEELGVRYVLEGSVQRSGERVRITVQMVDALTGSQLFSERFDGELRGLFDLQDDITLRVLSAVRVKLERRGVTGSAKYFRDEQGLDCMLKALEAWSHVQLMTLADTNHARKIAEEGLGLCTEIPFYHLLASININEYFLSSTKSPQESIEKATELLQKILSMDDSYVEAQALLSNVYTIRREYDKAIREGERAVALDPDSPWALFWYAATLTSAGKAAEAVPLFEKAIRLNPLGPAPLYVNFGHALRDLGRLEEAVSAYKKAVERAPNFTAAHAMLAAVYMMMGREAEARAAAAEVLRINPRYSVGFFAKMSTLKDGSKIELISDAMRKAGLPDKSPSVRP